jgi:hypothetical protein
MTQTAQTLTDQHLRSRRTPTVLAALSTAAARLRTRRRGLKATVQPAPFDPELHLIPPFALLVTGPR